MEEIQRDYSAANNWEKLGSEIKLRRVLFFYPLDIVNTAAPFRNKIASAKVVGSNPPPGLVLSLRVTTVLNHACLRLLSDNTGNTKPYPPIVLLANQNLHLIV